MPPAASAQPPEGQLTFRSGVDVIEIDVNVIDRDGQPHYATSTASDFRVRIDGEDRRVMQAQYVSLRSGSISAAAVDAFHGRGTFSIRPTRRSSAAG